MLLLLLACGPHGGTVREASPGGATPHAGAGGGDTTGDTDTDTDTETDTDTDTDADADADTDTDSDVDTGVGPSPLTGIDVSGWNPGIDWARVAGDGISFAIAKATEGDYYQSDDFTDQYTGSASVGLVRGAYHFGIPDTSDGASQAAYFIAHGGGWQADGKTLPGVLDIEYNPYGDTCYDLSQGEMEVWIRDFSDEYLARTGRRPMVYTNADWWNTCVGSTALSDDTPLWVAQWSGSSPTLPRGWSAYTFWQYSATGSVAGIDGDVDMSTFPADRATLVRFADTP